MMKRFLFMNRIDERGRFSGLEIHLCPLPSQVDTRGLSYLGARTMYQHNGETMAFDKSIFGYLLREREP